MQSHQITSAKICLDYSFPKLCS